MAKEDSNVRVLVLGDIVGRPGRMMVVDRLLSLRTEWGIDFCVANGENAAGGSGITPAIADELFEAGVDVLTTGDHAYKRKEIIPYLKESSRVLRPVNYGQQAAGSGYGVYSLDTGGEIAVINLVGRVFMNPSDCPFRKAEELVETIRPLTKAIIVDMHCEATSEKIAMGWHLNGRVSAVIGTHTHVQTADERILSGGTAYITDLGMTGPQDSILGRRKDKVLQAILTQMPTTFDVASADVRMCGAIITIDPGSGKAQSIKRIQVSADNGA